MPPAPEPIIATRLRGAGGEAVVGIVAVCCFVMAMVRKVRNMTDVLKVDIWRVLVQGAKVKVMTRRWWFRGYWIPLCEGWKESTANLDAQQAIKTSK